MNVVLWIVQALLAATYVMVGSMKAVRPLEALSKRIAWVRALPAGFVRFIGIAELLGAIGLILPMVTNIAPWLTVAAAAGLVLLQVCAIYLKLRGRDIPPWMLLAAVLLSIYDMATTFFGLGTVEWIAQAGVLVQGGLAVILTFIVELTVSFMLRR